MRGLSPIRGQVGNGELRLSLSETGDGGCTEGRVSPHCGLLQGLEVSQAAEHSGGVLFFCGLFTPLLYQATPQ